jgi:hypothetical protein
VISFEVCCGIFFCIKAVPLQALTDPEGSRRLRLQDFKTFSFPFVSNEIAKSCQDSLCHGQDIKQAPARCIAWSGLFDICVISSNKNIVAHW